MARQDHRSRRPPSRRTLLPATRRLAALAPEGTTGAVDRESETQGVETAPTDPGDRSDTGGSAIALIQTPQRFRTKRQLWSYSGLAIETHDSAEYRYMKGQLQRSKKPPQLRGL